MKRFNRIIAVILILSAFLTFFPAQIYAQEINNLISSFNMDAPKVEDVKKPAPKIIKEVEEKREKNIKTFLLEDKTYEADVYPVAVHFKNNGKWMDIDNTLVDAKDEDNNPVHENKSNNYKIKIAKNTMSNKLVRISKDKYELSWNMQDINNSLSDVRPQDTQKLNVLSENERKKTLPNLISEVNFSNIYQNTDLQYIIKPEEVKENIIINQRMDNPKFIFNLRSKNLSAKLLPDKSIVFVDEKDISKEIFRIDAPFMYDSNRNESRNIEVKLDKSSDGYILTLIPDQIWLNSPDTIYPVTIDPPVETSQDRSSIFDAHVTESLPTSNFKDSYILKTGTGVHRAYVKFVLPTLSSSDMVTEAYFAATLYSSNPAQRQIDVHKVTGAWNEDTITWNNKPGYNTKVEDYQQVMNANQEYKWNVTGIVKEWYTTGINNGLMMKNHDETVGYCEYYSSETSSAYLNSRPQVTVQYTNNSGLENYWTYHSQDVGRAGTGYVNDYNGNLVFIHDDVFTTGNLMPLSVSHVFNSNEKSTDISYGKGWRLNLSQSIDFENISGTEYYIYIDGDGTKHYLKSTGSGKYSDESGSGLVLTANTDKTYTIMDNMDNTYTFTSFAKLKSIADSNGNKIVLNYDESLKLVSAIDGASRTTTFIYDTATGLLKTITDPAQRTTSYDYNSSGQLQTVKYPDDKVTTFDYDTRGNFKSAQNYDGYKMVYSYTDGEPSKVKGIEEYGSNGTPGQYMDITYGLNSTTFKDKAGRKNTYIFSYYGNTVSIKDDDGSAQYYKYFNTEDSRKNKLSASSKLQKSIFNYLKNHNIEASTDWAIGNWTGSTATYGIAVTDTTTNRSFLGKQSLMITKTNDVSRHFYGQTVTLEKGKTYTLSGYIKTTDVTNKNGKGAALFVNYQNSAGTWETKDSRYASGTKDWERYEVSFTVPSDSASAMVYIRAGIVEETGTAYFDCLQLEDGIVSNRYNIIENADFKYSTSGNPNFWTKNSYTDTGDYLATTTGPAPGLDANIFRITGSATKSKSIYQTINLSGTVDDTFVISGWAKGESVPLASGRYFALDVGIKRTDGTMKYIIVPFNEDSSDWQYVSEVVKPDSAYTSVTVYALYYNNENKVYFDGIQLYKEEFQESYERDANGNITKTVDLAKQNSTMNYTANNEMSKYIDPSGSEFNYDYNDEGGKPHQLQKATSAENVVYSFTYNEKNGNMETASVGDPATIYLKSSTTYTGSGNYVRTVTDPDGNIVTFNYNELTGVLDDVTDGNGKVTNYQYDHNLDRLDTVSKTVDGKLVKNGYTYENDRLKTITHNGFSYTFNYDEYGRVQSVSVGNLTLVTNEYDPMTGNLTQSTYGNGQTTGFDYDGMDRVKAQKYGGVVKYKYEYDASGNVGYQEDLENKVNYRYIYDLSDRLVKMTESQNDTSKNIPDKVLSYDYDANSNMAKIKESIEGIDYVTSYVYDVDNRIKEITLNKGTKIEYLYDSIGRVKTTAVKLGTGRYETTYDFGTKSTLQTMTLPNGRTISYTYDGNGNIKTITDGGKVIEYKYNELNELIRENNQVLDKTIVYQYDTGGNILSKNEYAYTTDETPLNPTKVTPYGYGDAWGDKLTSYDGKTIGYDDKDIGNPTSYDGYAYTWEGRQLRTIVKGNTDISFKYNSEGIRTEKKVGDIKTYYHLVGDKVTYEKTVKVTKNNTTPETTTETALDVIYYSYDSAGNLVSMNLNGDEYYYVRNNQGDILGLLDDMGVQVVSYTYDSWGKLVSIDGSLKDSLGVKNPYRYRGYRYDTETGLYYLQSRYYSPEWGRFLNVDALVGVTGELLGHNMFLYSLNNPINLNDPSGFRPIYTMNPEDETDVMLKTSLLSMKSGKSYSQNSKTKKSVAQMGLEQSLGYMTNSKALGKEAAKNPYVRAATGVTQTGILVGVNPYVGGLLSGSQYIGDAVLEDMGKPQTLYIEASFAAQGSIFMYGSESARYFGIMLAWDEVGKSLSSLGASIGSSDLSHLSHRGCDY